MNCLMIAPEKDWEQFAATAIEAPPSHLTGDQPPFSPPPLRSKGAFKALPPKANS
jgi:hypothetical protein